jgi:type I restriction enzyme S subunit
MAGELPATWKMGTIRESVQFYAGGDPFLKLEYEDDGIPVLAKGDVKPFGRIEHGDKRFISRELAEQRGYRTTKAGDFLLTTRDLTQEANFLGLLAAVPGDRKYLVNQGANVVRFSDDINPRYIVYWCNSPIYRAHIKGHHVGSTQIHLRKDDFLGAPLLRPPLKEQRAIAHILGTLDDKIELNRRLNETLEAIARALFKSWFVDFDPVRAKSEGRDSGLPSEIADLFPDSFEESELGEIPKGWEIAELGDHFQAVKGVSYKGSGLCGAGMPLHNLNSIYEGGGYKYEGIKFYDGEYAERHLVKPGDVIVANTEQGHKRLLIGYAAIVPALFGEQGIASHHIYCLRPINGGSLTPAFLCHLLNSPRMHDLVSGYANGTTVNMLPPDGVQQPQIIVPPEALVQAFDELAIRIETRREGMVIESRTLAALRDALLPKLISGELRVRDAERKAASLT